MWEETRGSTHTDTRRACKLHTQKCPRLYSNPRPSCCEGTVLTTLGTKTSSLHINFH
uniref:Uncharacterized protein n=1 Tax=Anguilla anguilla TaxID=7936 RepID=A0A0E9S0Z2_ANGAN